ncbi:MAG: hypothetical protein AB7S26_16760 [Sandaracinaceae bacterium]
MLFDTEFEDELTIIDLSFDAREAFEPPPLPIPLVCRRELAEPEPELTFRALASGLFG